MEPNIAVGMSSGTNNTSYTISLPETYDRHVQWISTTGVVFTQSAGSNVATATYIPYNEGQSTVKLEVKPEGYNFFNNLKLTR